MLNPEVTKKSMESPRTYRVGYCELQTLLSFKSPAAHSSSRVNGWSCDYYYLGNGVTISTGYRPIGINVPDSLIRKYEALAHKVRQNNCLDTEKSADELDKLIDQFVAELTRE